MKDKNSKSNSTKDSPKKRKNTLYPVFVESWHTDLKRKLKVGDRFVLPTIAGKMEFEVVSIEKDRALIECGNTQARLKKIGQDKWRYNHITWPKDFLVKVQVI